MFSNTEYKNSIAYKFFEEITKIPRGSGNVKQIADYITSFAENKGYYVYRDDHDSVLVRRKAHPKYADKPAILLQGHTDMVCEKVPDIEFDFTKDPLKIAHKDGFVFAQGTTLGADNGAAVALMLSLLDDDALECPELECLFTSDEEIGLIGAKHFDYSKIKARKMLNLDIEDETEAVVGSAGGVSCNISAPVGFTKTENDTKTYKVIISGLKGGHSGCDINLGRMSAAVITAKFLKLCADKIAVNSISCGNMDNAIARDSEITLVCSDKDFLMSTASDLEASLKAKTVDDDAALSITVSECNGVDKVYTDSFKNDLIALMCDLPHGVYAMCRDLDNLVESSANFASVKSNDTSIKLCVSARSSIEATIESMKEKIKFICEKYNFNVNFCGQYPGWQYNPQSELASDYKELYNQITGKELKLISIHAGLECGLFKHNIPDMDIISIGPTMYDIHTPNERMNIESFLKFERLVRAMITK